MLDKAWQGHVVSRRREVLLSSSTHATLKEKTLKNKKTCFRSKCQRPFRKPGNNLWNFTGVLMIMKQTLSNDMIASQTLQEQKTIRHSPLHPWAHPLAKFIHTLHVEPHHKAGSFSLAGLGEWRGRGKTKKAGPRCCHNHNGTSNMHKRLWRYDMHQLEHLIIEKEAVVATSRKLAKGPGGASHLATIRNSYEIIICW